MSLRLRSNLLYQKFVMNESPATASLRSATPKKKCSLLFGFARDRFFLKMERTFFFGVLPSKYSGSVAGLQTVHEQKVEGVGGRKLFAHSLQSILHGKFKKFAISTTFSFVTKFAACDLPPQLELRLTLCSIVGAVLS